MAAHFAKATSAEPLLPTRQTDNGAETKATLGNSDLYERTEVAATLQPILTRLSCVSETLRSARPNGTQ